ncbi:MAG TPA: SDR family NAD(P)-dependent oxidoreductase [Terriglobales bacterium]|nr:SDR family NAD(P)-dependent oxidoreductase [Terriglobales bacterium]
MSKRFDGYNVFVTGAASGVGRATAVLLASEGAQVIAADVNREGLAETVETIRASGGQVHADECNVADAASVRQAIARAAEQLGGLKVLVNAAGVGKSQRFEELAEDEWRRVMSVNLDGAFFAMQAALPYLLANRGNIVNVASIAGLRGQAYNAAYCASKAGLINLTRSIALEFASRKVRANCICPGGIKTPLIRNFIPQQDFEPSLIAYFSPPVPHRLADPESVAKVIAFLASDDAKHISGSALVADDATLA